jgi:hypothetical protein
VLCFESFAWMVLARLFVFDSVWSFLCWIAGAALLRFKAGIDADPYGALLDWDEESLKPCSWFGVECSDDGLVMAL